MLRARIFYCPQIRLMQDKYFPLTWQPWKKCLAVLYSSWPNYHFLKQLLKSYEHSRVQYVHFLHSHVNCFPENLEAMIEEQTESFHQDEKTVEKRYQGLRSTTWWQCCDRKSWAACAQSFAPRQQATIEITLLLLVRATYIYFCSSRTSRSWWITQSTQHHRRGCNSRLLLMLKKWGCW